MTPESSTTLEFANGSRLHREDPVPTELPIVRNGPPATIVVFPNGKRIGVPTDQILHADDAHGHARVSFGGMRFDGLEEGQLTFRRFREVRPEHELTPERGRLMRLDPKDVSRVLVGSRVVWPDSQAKHPSKLQVTAEDMASTTLFRDVDLGLIIDRLRHCEQRVVRAGDTVIEQGEDNETIYMVLEGHLYIRLVSVEETDISVAVVGDCVGEMSVIDGRAATATVLAKADTTLLCLPGELIWTLIDHTTLVSRNLLYILAGRLRMGDRQISAGQDERARFQRFATQDLLTGLRNRRWLDDELERRFETFQKQGTAQTVIMFDVDHFKLYNDKHGHQAGDLILQRVARATNQALQNSGTAARYGGEEFMVLAGDLQVEDALMLAESIRRTVAAIADVEYEGKWLPGVTISMGVARLEPGMTPSDLVRRADEALYRAKRSGRNRVVKAEA